MGNRPDDCVFGDRVAGMIRPGEFRLTESGHDGLSLLIFGPRNRAELNSGMVKQIAIALWLKPEAKVEQLAEFLNAIYQGDQGRLEKLVSSNGV